MAHHAHHPVASADTTAHPEGGHELDHLPLKTLYTIIGVGIVAVILSSVLWGKVMHDAAPELAATAAAESVLMVAE